MSIAPVNNITFTGGDYQKGKKIFESLSKTEQAGKIGAEMFRQKFNRHNVGFKLSEPEGDLGAYVRLRVSISNAIKKVLDKRK